jgi:hypothetical protein
MKLMGWISSAHQVFDVKHYLRNARHLELLMKY